MWVILFLLSLFEDFFSISPSCQSRFVYGATLHDFFVSECSFIGSNVNENGGVIKYENAVVHFVAEDCLFYNCRVGASNCGSGIYFKCTNGGIVVNRICAFYCYISSASSNNGVFMSSQSSNTNKNYLLLSSFRHCPHNSFSSSRYSINAFTYGYCQTKYINMSQNYVERPFGYYTTLASFEFRYNTMVDSMGYVGYGFYIDGTSSSLDFIYLNYVNNSANGNLGSANPAFIRFSVFKNNLNKLFSGSLTIRNCSI